MDYGDAIWMLHIYRFYTCQSLPSHLQPLSLAQPN
jgi:hypothetical protein